MGKDNVAKGEGPWLAGIVDALTAAKLILNTSIPTRNRIALIILDSALEVTFKDYLTYSKKMKLTENHQKIREELHKVMKKNSNLTDDEWSSIDFYYDKRCNLYHEDASTTLSDTGILDFFTMTVNIVDKLFGTECQKNILEPNSLLMEKKPRKIKINELSKIIDSIVAALGKDRVSNSAEVVTRLKIMGFKGKISPSIVTTYFSQYPHIFYFDKEGKTWQLTDEGTDHYFSLAEKHGGSI